MDDIGLIPGRYTLSNKKSIFGTFFTQNFTKYLEDKSLPYLIIGAPRDCFNTSTLCQIYLKKAIAFVRTMNVLYPMRKYSDIDYLEERPDFYLGRFFQMFSDKISNSNFANDNWFDCGVRKFDDTLLGLINNPMMEFFTQTWLNMDFHSI